MKDKISVILPLYNSEKYLTRCMDSIINQTYENLEIILINDGSTDNTLEIVNEYANNDSRILVIDKKNTGVSDTRNIGISKSTGEYITFVDSDDWLELNAIEKLYNCIKKNNYSIVRGSYKLEYNSYKSSFSVESFAYNVKDSNINIQRLIDKVISGEMYCYMWLLLIKADKIKDKVFFNTGLAMMEDTIFYLDLLLDNNDIFFLKEVTYHYFVNETSASRNINNLKRNFDNSISVNFIFERKLNYNRCNSKNRKKLYNTKTSKSIAETVYKLYKLDKKEFQKIYDKISNSLQLQSILNNCDLNSMNTQNRYIIKFLKQKKYYCLLLFLRLRAVLAIIKRKKHKN